MNDKKEGYCLCIDEKTINLLDDYGEKLSLSRSATLRMIVNEYFLKKEVS